MALIRKYRTTESSLKALEKKAEKNGFRYTFFSPNGNEYTGEWRDDLRHGDGVQVWKKAGIMYDGEWKRGERDGYGTLYRLQKSTKKYIGVYSGKWRNDQKEGFGVYFYSSSSTYEGEWVQNERTGWGKMTYANGDVYEGEWFRNKPHGQGVLTLVNGNMYEGWMKDGKKHGQGRFIFTNKGQVYEGTWVDGMAKFGTLSVYNEKNTETEHTHQLSSTSSQ